MTTSPSPADDAVRRPFIARLAEVLPDEPACRGDRQPHEEAVPGGSTFAGATRKTAIQAETTDDD